MVFKTDHRLMHIKRIANVLQNAPREHYSILSTCIKLPAVLKTFVFLIFEWPLKTDFTVHQHKQNNKAHRSMSLCCMPFVVGREGPNFLKMQIFE